MKLRTRVKNNINYVLQEIIFSRSIEVSPVCEERKYCSFKYIFINIYIHIFKICLYVCIHYQWIIRDYADKIKTFF